MFTFGLLDKVEKVFFAQLVRAQTLTVQHLFADQRLTLTAPHSRVKSVQVLLNTISADFLLNMVARLKVATDTYGSQSRYDGDDSNVDEEYGTGSDLIEEVCHVMVRWHEYLSARVGLHLVEEGLLV